MKAISEKFTDEEFARLKRLKKDISWHDFIILLEMHGRQTNFINKKDELKEELRVKKEGLEIDNS
jgi:hypothetical protein